MTLKEISHGNGGVSANIADSTLHIDAFDIGFADKIPNYLIQLNFKLTSGVNTYVTDSHINRIYLLHRNREIKNWQAWQSESNAMLTITRLDNKVVAGKFEGILIPLHGGMDLTLSDGRFDVKLE